MDQQTKIYQAWPPWKRLEAAWELYRFAKEIIRTREKKIHPHLSKQGLEKHIRSFFR